MYIGTTWKNVTYTVDQNGKKEQKIIQVRIVYEMTERTIDKYGQVLLMPEIELNMWWTNLGWSDAEIIASYHAHGECEQYHSEIKTDMDVERLPSGKFKTNALVLDLTILAFNILRIIGYYSVRTGSAPKTKRPVKQRRIRTVIDRSISFTHSSFRLFQPRNKHLPLKRHQRVILAPTGIAAIQRRGRNAELSPSNAKNEKFLTSY